MVIIKVNRLPSNGTKIKYVAPMIVNGEVEVVIEEHDIVSEMQYWENYLIRYNLRTNLSMIVVKKFMINIWNFVALPDLYYNEEGYFIIRLKTKIDKDVVIMRGTYTIYHKPMFFHEWTPDFNLKNDLLRLLPIWVMFPYLH